MSEPTTTSARAHVLIVEDSSVFREMQSLLLRQAGYAISAHEHPHAALAARVERIVELSVFGARFEFDAHVDARGGQLLSEGFA